MSYFRDLFISRVIDRDLYDNYQQSLIDTTMHHQEEIISSTFLYKKNIHQKNRCYFVQSSNEIREQNVCADLHDYTEQLQRTMNDNIYKLDIHCSKRSGDNCKHNYNVVETSIIEYEKIYLYDLLKQTYLYKVNCPNDMLVQIYNKLFLYMNTYNITSNEYENEMCIKLLVNNVNIWLIRMFEKVNKELKPLIEYYLTYIPNLNIIDIPTIINSHRLDENITLKFIDIYIDNKLNENTKIIHNINIK